MKTEYLIKKQEEERLARIAKERNEAQKELGHEAQHTINNKIALWVFESGIPSKPPLVVPAYIQIAATTRVTVTVRVMVPPSMPEWRQEELLHDIYEAMDGSEIVDPDVDYFEEGTHTLNYIEE